MHVGITGGTGFLGRHLAARLLARGDRVLVYTRDPLRARGPDGVRFEAWRPGVQPLPPPPWPSWTRW